MRVISIGFIFLRLLSKLKSVLVIHQDPNLFFVILRKSIILVKFNFLKFSKNYSNILNFCELIIALLAAWIFSILYSTTSQHSYLFLVLTYLIKSGIINSRS